MQLAQLKAMVDRHSDLVRDATIQEGLLRKDAYLRALDEGSVRSIETPRAQNPLDPAQASAAQKGAQLLQKEVMDDLTRQKGSVGTGFVFTMMTSSEPDGISRSNFIIVERSKHPEYFRALDEMKQRIVKRDTELAGFFHKL